MYKGIYQILTIELWEQFVYNDEECCFRSIDVVKYTAGDEYHGA